MATQLLLPAQNHRLLSHTIKKIAVQENVTSLVNLLLLQK